VSSSSHNHKKTTTQEPVAPKPVPGSSEVAIQQPRPVKAGEAGGTDCKGAALLFLVVFFALMQQDRYQLFRVSFKVKARVQVNIKWPSRD
jgi:hypothetical protein